MGSFAFALGGALAGAGQGIEKVGAEQMLEMREAKLQALRAAEQEKLQATGIEAQKGLQQAGFTEQERMHGIEHGEAVAAAGAQRQFLTDLEKYKQGEATTRAKIRAGSVVEAARLRAGAAAGKAKAPVSEWSSAQVPYVGDAPGGTDRQGAPIMLHGQQLHATILHHKGGQDLIEVPSARGPRLVPFTGQDQLARLSDKSYLDQVNSMKPAPAEHVQDLMSHPDRWPDFLHTYGYLPGGVRNAWSAQYQRRLQAYQSAPATGQQESDGAEEARVLQDDRDAGDDEDAAGQSVNGVPYSPTPTGAPQASDTAPAQ
jgi:hypothetical protein